MIAETIDVVGEATVFRTLAQGTEVRVDATPSNVSGRLALDVMDALTPGRSVGGGIGYGYIVLSVPEDGTFGISVVGNCTLLLHTPVLLEE